MTTSEFEAQVRRQEQIVIIDMQGVINSDAESGLGAAYEQAEAASSQTIVLNFSQVDYINSTGIALIVGLLARARKSHKILAVFGLSDHYREIFNITRLADFMQIYQDEASLLAA